CKTDKKPFSEIGFIPVKYSSKLEKSFFARDYFEEMIKAHIDNLNLLYVALTRAEEFLMINCPPKSGSLKSAGDLVTNVVEKMVQGQDKGNSVVSVEEETSVKKYTIGSLTPIERKPSATDHSIFPSKYETSDWRQKIAVRKKGGLLIGPEVLELKAKINYGLLVHEILAGIKNEAEADLLVEKYHTEGQISMEERQTLIGQLNVIFSNPQVQSWFNTDWEVKTEIPIIVKNEWPRRPDRVMLQGKNAIIIDFKTGATKPTDKKQVLEYKELLEEMGYLNVEVYLLYIGLNKIIKVA
ncbi:MAG: hypothetical protein KAI29_23760, partial [Cyclobacteriaceae bacterium]|nr:hypothetical protein [Cyclobacteriaceae bacterium]